MAGNIIKNSIAIYGGTLSKEMNKYITEKLYSPIKIGEYSLLVVINGAKKFETYIFEQIQNSY